MPYGSFSLFRRSEVESHFRVLDSRKEPLQEYLAD
jgi:hypothetical protein